MSKKVNDSESASELASKLRALMRKLKRRLREQGTREDLTPSQMAVVFRLEKDGPSTVSSLARAEGVRPQSMSAIIAALQDAGIVEGAADPSDGRQTLMSLSKNFEKRLHERRAARQDWLTAVILQKLTPQEQTQIEDTLRLLERLTED